MSYCIYTNRNVSDEEGNIDHIIPLSLGGNNGFTVWAERDFNSCVGTNVDGAIANDPIIMFGRRNADARGHSNAPPIPMFKRSTIAGRPAQISFRREELQIWDARLARYLTEDEKIGKEISSIFYIDSYAPLRFMAKVVLGGGYFIYGQDIENYADCDVLRSLISFKPESDNIQLRVAHHVQICDRYDPKAYEDKTDEHVRRLICEFTGSSLFVSEFSANAVTFHVAVVGMYIGSIVFFKEGLQLPLDAEAAIGHGILSDPSGMQRITFRHLLEKFYREVLRKEPPRPDFLK